MSQTFKTVDVLRLEIEDDPTGLTNLVQNPSGELGGWGWVTPVVGSTLYGDLGYPALEYVSPGVVASYFYTEPMPISATQYAAAAYSVIYANGFYRVKFEWLDASQVLLSSSTQSGYLSDPADDDLTIPYGPYQAPASTAYVRLRFDHYSTNTGTAPTAGQGIEIHKVTVAKAATSGALGTIRTNIVPNPSFEQTAWGWEVIEVSASVARSTAQAAVGSASLLFTAGATSGYDGPASEMFAASPSTTYAFQYRTRAASTTRYTYLQVNWYDSTGKFISASTGAGSTNSSGSWTTNTTVQTSPSNTVYMRLELAFTSTLAAGEQHYFDAFMVEAASEAGTYFDGSSSGGGVTYAYTTANRTNLSPNPSLESNATGWSVTAGTGSGARSTTLAYVGSASYKFTASGGGTAMEVACTASGTSGMPVTAGKRYAFRHMVYPVGISGTNRHIRYVDWYTSGGTLISTSTSTYSNITIASWNSSVVTALAPATAAYARVRVRTERRDGGTLTGSAYMHVDAVLFAESDDVNDYFDGSTTDLTNYTYAWTGTTNNSTSTLLRPVAHTATTSNLAYIEPVTYVNVLGPTHEINVSREALNVGSLSATILDAVLDPSQDDLIRPGKRLRLTVLDPNDQWTPIFTGKVSEASVTYQLKDPRVPEQKRARVEIVALDNTAALANQRRPDGVAAIADLPYVLEGCGVPWNVNGSGDQVPSATVVSSNDNASAIDQIAITRDSVHAYAWVDRFGTVQVWDDPTDAYANGVTLDDGDASDLDLSYNTTDCINEVVVKYLRYSSTTGETEEIAYGPYRDATSISEWGVRSAEFTIHGITETSGNMQTFADAVLAANATPLVTLNSATVPLASAADVADWCYYTDLYVAVTPTLDAYTPGGAIFCTSIEHSITPDKWLMRLGFAETDVMASPQVAPPVQSTPAVANGTLQWYDSAATTSLTNATTTALTAGWALAGSTTEVYGTRSSGTVTFTVAGTYMVNFSATFASSTAGRRIVFIMKNNAEHRRVDVGSGGACTVEVSAYVTVVAGDNIDVRVHQTSGGALALGSSPGHDLQIVKVGG